MSDYPIIFSTPMVRALLDGRKTMTRRKAWSAGPRMDRRSGLIIIREVRPTVWQKVRPGDRLWVREAWCLDERFYLKSLYRADDDDGQQKAVPISYKSPIYMPRWASRITLVVTAARIEQLRDIKKQSLSQVQAEGLDVGPLSTEGAWHQFMFLWDSLHGAGSWDANPEVVALTFTVRKANIDAMEAA